jgi:hypothetical protein
MAVRRNGLNFASGGVTKFVPGGAKFVGGTRRRVSPKLAFFHPSVGDTRLREGSASARRPCYVPRCAKLPHGVLRTLVRGPVGPASPVRRVEGAHNYWVWVLRTFAFWTRETFLSPSAALRASGPRAAVAQSARYAAGSVAWLTAYSKQLLASQPDVYISILGGRKQ